MELKDVILSTLAEIEELTVTSETAEESESARPQLRDEEPKAVAPVEEQRETVSLHGDEIRMLEGIRERLLVLFEGFQSPNNVKIEAKVDLTLNFLEYLLATIDSRLESIKE